MLIKNLSPTLVNGTLGKVIEFDADHSPVVEFVLNEKAKVVKTIMREVWTIDVPGRKTPLSRSQIPLILSYAMYFLLLMIRSIHKSQGQTLERVKVDLGKVFEYGQAYVALSRAKSMDALEVLNFNPKKVFTNDVVVKFHAALELSDLI